MATLLVSLWLKTLLNWVVLLVQKDHLRRSFLSVFCVSLALADALLHLSVTCVFLAQDVQVFGLHLTKYHVCAVVQVACSVQGVLHWPVFALSALDTLCSLRGSCPRSTVTLVYVAVTLLLWTLSSSYVLSVPDYHPLTRDEDEHVILQLCQLTGRAQSRQVAWASLLALVGVAFYIIRKRKLSELLKDYVGHFLSSWSCFLLLLFFVLSTGTEVPPYLELNGVWLCFIHGLHTAVGLRNCDCVFCTRTQDDDRKGHVDHAHLKNSGFSEETSSAQTLHTRRLA
ncbi:MAG: hypothetical protein ACRC4N_02920 [Gammaproteobacteria bacterium]